MSTLIELLRAYKAACFAEERARYAYCQTGADLDCQTWDGQMRSRGGIEQQLIDRFRPISEIEQSEAMVKMEVALLNRGHHHPWCAIDMAKGEPCSCAESADEGPGRDIDPDYENWQNSRGPDK